MFFTYTFTINWTCTYVFITLVYNYYYLFFMIFLLKQGMYLFRLLKLPQHLFEVTYSLKCNVSIDGFYWILAGHWTSKSYAYATENSQISQTHMYTLDHAFNDLLCCIHFSFLFFVSLSCPAHLLEDLQQRFLILWYSALVLAFCPAVIQTCSLLPKM